MPTASDLVTDLPADFETFGQAVATSMADLLGGTTGQVLSKASNTDMDFTWVTSDDANAIQNSIVDAKGDLIAASANDTPARLAVGTNGQVLTADSTAATGLAWAAPSTSAESLGFTAGKNKIINGNFSINQRGLTSTTAQGYGFDRWSTGNSGGTVTYSSQAFTPGTAPVTGYEAANFARLVTSGQSAAGNFAYVFQRIEDVRSYANQTITVSLWAKASTGTPKLGISIEQFFGSGGSSDVVTSTTPVTISSSWARYSVTVAIPSISGKTIGTGSSLGIGIMTSAGTTISAAGYPAVGVQNVTIDFWGVQAEAGSTATAFQTATGTIQGELSAAQRYYTRTTGNNSSALLGTLGFAKSTSLAVMPFALPVTMRTAVSAIDIGGTPQIADGNTGYSGGTWALDSSSSTGCTVTYTHGSATLTQYRPYFPQATTSTSYIGFSAEL